MVSVITVTRNSGEMLKETINSVIGQTYKDMEYIIVDGKSTDSSVDIIKSYADSISQWVSEPDGGIYDAMNKGVRMSRGKWIIFMNAGDGFADRDVLSRVFAEERDGDIIYGDVLKRGKDGAVTMKKAEPAHNSHRMFFCHQSALARRDCLIGEPFDVAHKMSADFKFFKKMFLGGKKFIKLEFPIALFDTTGVSNSQRSKGLMDNIKVVKEVDNWFDRLKLLPRLYFTYYNCRLRNK